MYLHSTLANVRNPGDLFSCDAPRRTAGRQHRMAGTAYHFGVIRDYFAVRMLFERLDEKRRISRHSCRLLRVEYPSDECPYRPARDR